MGQPIRFNFTSYLPEKGMVFFFENGIVAAVDAEQRTNKVLQLTSKKEAKDFQDGFAVITQKPNPKHDAFSDVQITLVPQSYVEKCSKTDLAKLIGTGERAAGLRDGRPPQSFESPVFKDTKMVNIAPSFSDDYIEQLTWTDTPPPLAMDETHLMPTPADSDLDQLVRTWLKRSFEKHQEEQEQQPEKPVPSKPTTAPMVPSLAPRGKFTAPEKTLAKSPVVEKTADGAITHHYAPPRRSSSPTRRGGFRGVGMPIASTTEPATPAPAPAPKAADSISDAQKKDLIAALNLIAKTDDGAVSKDNTGFNQEHTEIGKDLAAAKSLSEVEARVARQLVRFYKRQILAKDPELYNRATTGISGGIADLSKDAIKETLAADKRQATDKKVLALATPFPDSAEVTQTKCEGLVALLHGAQQHVRNKGSLDGFESNGVIALKGKAVVLAKPAYDYVSAAISHFKPKAEETISSSAAYGAAEEAMETAQASFKAGKELNIPREIPGKN